MRRQAQYLYVSDLIRDRRVLEAPCGDGRGARFLAEHGAAHVVGVDPSRSAIEEASRSHRLSNLEWRCEDLRRIELDDGAVDAVMVSDGAQVIRRQNVLEELARVLVPGGLLVVAARSADRAGGLGGVSYHELVDRLAPLFGEVAMVAQLPLSGWAMVGFDDDGGEVDGVVLDRTLVARGPEPTDYVAIAGAGDGALGSYTLIETEAGADDALAAELGAEPLEPDDADRAAVPSAVPEEQTQPGLQLPVGGPPPAMPIGTPPPLPSAFPGEAAAPSELATELSEAQAAVVDLRDRVGALETENERLEASLRELRDQAGKAEGEAVDLRRQLTERDDAHQARAGEVDRLEQRVLELEAELEQARAAASLEAELEEAQQRRAQLERSLEEAEEARAELEDQLAEAGATADEMRRALLDVDPSRAVAAEDSTRARLAMMRTTRQLEDDLASARKLLDELVAGLGELADTQLEALAGGVDDQVRSMSIELGVKEAELTLLNIGVSSLQGRVARLVGDVRATYRAMQGQSADEMLAMMDELARNLD
jgi:SAM-dependent methyltransferase